MMRLLIATLIVFLVSYRAPAGALYSDGTFSSSDWQSDVMFTANAGGSVTGTQALTGGNPGEAWRVLQTNNNGPFAAIYAFHGNSNFVFDTSTSGAIDTVTFSLDDSLVGGGGTQGIAIAIRQGGRVFRGTSWLATTGWTTTGATLTASDFALRLTSGAVDSNQNPDFGPGAGLLEFGFETRTSNSRVGSGGSRTVLYDNFSAAITTVVPEPGAATLCFGCLAFTWTRRRRN